MSRIYLSLAFLPVLALAACTSAQVSQVSGYEQAVEQACVIAGTALDSATASGSPLSNSAVVSAANLVHSACGTEQAVASLVLSPTSVAWLNTLITTIKSGGTVVPPAPITSP